MTDRDLIKAELQNLQKILEAKADMCIGAGKIKMLSFANACSGALELLEEQKGKGKDVPTKWIRCKDRLPDWKQDKRVLVVCIEPYYKLTVVDFMRFYNGVWTYDGKPTKATVTHWMPLPEPPKEAEA